MFGWFINRNFETTGLIPEGMLELDDLVLAGNRDKLVEIFENTKKAVMPDFGIEAKDLDNKMLASWSWYFLKSVPNIWQYIPHTGKYAKIFGYERSN